MNQQALAQLKDIHLPAPSPWWELAAGWWLLLALVLILLIWGLPRLRTFWIKRRNQRLLKQDMQAELQAICQAYQEHHDAHQTLADINILLKKVALTLFPKQQVASLTGKAWLDFLDQHWQEKFHEKPDLSFTSKRIASLLTDGAYRADVMASDQDIQALCDVARAWLKAVQRHV